MKIVWVTRSFLDYRIPVFRELDHLAGGNLHLFFSGDYVPAAVTEKARSVLGSRAHPLSGERSIGPEDQHHMANRNLSFRWQPGLFRQIRSMSPDVLVCDGFFKYTLPALGARIRDGTPLVVAYERTSHTERNAQAIRTRYRKGVVRLVDALVCSGKLCKEYSVNVLGMDPERITVGHMSADTDFLAAASDTVTPSERQALRDRYGLRGTVFLYVGRLDKRKGIAELLDAWRAAGFAKGEASLLIVGGGPQEADLKAAAADMKTVCFSGRIPYDDLYEVYSAANTFIIPTLEDNWSLVVPEAMSCKLPIISSIYNGCWPEFATSENGWVFDPKDAAASAAILKEAYAAGLGGLSERGAASRRIVESFGPQNAARSIFEACEIAITKRSPPRRPSS